MKSFGTNAGPGEVDGTARPVRGLDAVIGRKSPPTWHSRWRAQEPLSARSLRSGPSGPSLATGCSMTAFSRVMSYRPERERRFQSFRNCRE